MTYSLQDLVGFAQQAGFQGSSAQTIAAIAYAESSGNPYAINYSDPGGSYGLTQINAAAHGPTAVNTLGNPLEAFTQAFRVSQGGTNFTPWSTYNNGAYAPFLAQLGGTPTVFSPFGGGAPAGSAGVSGSGSGGSLSGTTATGAPTTAQSPLSAIFGSIGNLFQQFGFMILGGLLVAVGAWYLAKPGKA